MGKRCTQIVLDNSKHVGFTYDGDLVALCDELRARGAELVVEPWEFNPGTLLCYLAAPDGVSIEIVQGRK